MFYDAIDTDRLFSEDLILNDNWVPAINIKENKKNINEKEDDYSRKEFYYNSLTRLFTLPKSIDFSKKFNAKYDKGVLKINLEKMEILKSEEHRKMIEII